MLPSHPQLLCKGRATQNKTCRHEGMNGAAQSTPTVSVHQPRELLPEKRAFQQQWQSGCIFWHCMTISDLLSKFTKQKVTVPPPPPTYYAPLTTGHENTMCRQNSASSSGPPWWRTLTTISTQSPNATLLTIKGMVGKNQKKQRSSCLDKPGLAQGGVGVVTLYVQTLVATTNGTLTAKRALRTPLAELPKARWAGGRVAYRAAYPTQSLRKGGSRGFNRKAVCVCWGDGGAEWARPFVSSSC